MVLPLKKIDSFLTGKLQMLQVTSGAACNKTFSACSTWLQSFIIKDWSHVLYLKWQNCEIYIAIISVANGHHVSILDCNFSVQQ